MSAAAAAAVTLSPGARMNADISALMRARNTLLWIVTREEMRVERAIVDAAGLAKYSVKLWDCATGISGADGSAPDASMRDPNAALQWLAGPDGKRVALVMRDLHDWIGEAGLKRVVRSFARSFQALPPSDARVIVVLSPTRNVPPELAAHATILEYPIPDRGEIAALLDTVIATNAAAIVESEYRASARVYDAADPAVLAKVAANVERLRLTRDKSIDAAIGLTSSEAENCYARSLVTTRALDPALVASEKKRVIAGVSGLQWVDADPRGLDAIGGYGEVKTWCAMRRAAFGPPARAYGLPDPKGVLLVGVPGSGKTLFAKCVATALGLPLLRADLGGTQSKYVGESQANLRAMLRTAETIAPCVLHIDEIEKALAGATGPQGDGGVSADALGTLLSWMQDQRGVFVVATANDVRGLPPELLRKGRFDEIFFSDLPTAKERGEILSASLRQYKRVAFASADVDAVAAATEGFTGSEIAAIVPEAMFVAFADGERAITAADVLTAARAVTPLSKTASEKIKALQEWSKGRARSVSSVDTTSSASTHRGLDL